MIIIKDKFKLLFFTMTVVLTLLFTCAFADERTLSKIEITYDEASCFLNSNYMYGTFVDNFEKSVKPANMTMNDLMKLGYSVDKAGSGLIYLNKNVDRYWGIRNISMAFKTDKPDPSITYGLKFVVSVYSTAGWNIDEKSLPQIFINGKEISEFVIEPEYNFKSKKFTFAIPLEYVEDVDGYVDSIKNPIKLAPQNELKVEETISIPEVIKEEEKPSEPEYVRYIWKNASTWAYSELGEASNNKLYPDIFIDVDLTKNITRKEFAHISIKLYEKLSNKKATPVEKNPFEDTDDEEVLKALNLGITYGISSNSYAPDDEITREQLATMIKRTLEKSGIEGTIDLNKVELFADDDKINSWGREAIYYLFKEGLIKGIGDNNFGVKSNATIEQALIIALRSYKHFSK